MKKFRLLNALRIVAMAAVAVIVFGEVVMRLWNWLMPSLFGLRSLTFLQAIGLLLLSKLLFGGFHRHAGGRGWRRQTGERFATMTPEERERFRSGMRDSRWCRPSHSAETRSEKVSA